MKISLLMDDIFLLMSENREESLLQLVIKLPGRGDNVLLPASFSGASSRNFQGMIRVGS
jgi:hypothetical protein